MGKIDSSIKFISINIGLITISDTRNDQDDDSGNILKERITNFGHIVYTKKIISDDIEKIKSTLNELSDNKSIDAIITTGGTGLTGRDSTPEAIVSLSSKIIDGFGELMRMRSVDITPNAILSRGLAAVVGNSLVITLPGKPQGAVECLEFVEGAIAHTVKLCAGAPTSC